MFPRLLNTQLWYNSFLLLSKFCLKLTTDPISIYSRTQSVNMCNICHLDIKGGAHNYRQHLQSRQHRLNMAENRKISAAAKEAKKKLASEFRKRESDITTPSEKRSRKDDRSKNERHEEAPKPKPLGN